MNHEPFDTLASAAPPARPRRERGRGRIPWIVGAAAAAVVAAAFTGAFVAGHYEARLGQVARELAATRQRLQREVATLNDQLAVYRSVADLLGDPATQVTTLRGLGPSAGALGRVIWRRSAGGSCSSRTCRRRRRARRTSCGRSARVHRGPRASSWWTPRGGRLTAWSRWRRASP